MSISKNSKTSGIVFTFLLFAVGFVSLFSHLPVFAAPCGAVLSTDERAAGACDETNWNDAKSNGFGGDKEAFNKLRYQCETTDSVNDDAWYGFALGYGTDATSDGNCSNAIQSCYLNSVDTTACQDANVLALIASCNEGAVGPGAADSGQNAGGAKSNASEAVLNALGLGGILSVTAGCGTDNAINTVNQLKGKGYQTNNGVQDTYFNDVALAECQQTNDAEKDTCKGNLMNDLRGCLTDNGYTKPMSGGGYTLTKKIDQTIVKKCMTDKANTDSKCSARTGGKGTWKNGKCTPALEDQDYCDVNYPSIEAANPGNPTVDEAKQITRMYELNLACKAGEKGGDCEALYTKDSESGFTTKADLVAACNNGKNKKKDADCLKAADGTTCIVGTLDGGTKQCGQASTNIIGCGTDQGATALNNVLRIFVIVLSFGVGIAAVGSIAYSAIRYAGARDNQSDVSLARERIRNVVIGLLLYGFLIAIANWLVPGGIF